MGAWAVRIPRIIVRHVTTYLHMEVNIMTSGKAMSASVTINIFTPPHIALNYGLEYLIAL